MSTHVKTLTPVGRERRFQKRKSVIKAKSDPFPGPIGIKSFLTDGREIPSNHQAPRKVIFKWIESRQDSKGADDVEDPRRKADKNA